MTVGITGASGHIGNVVCRFLLQKGINVKAMYNRDKRALEDIEYEPGLELWQGNILDLDFLEKFVSGCDVVVNCAAIISIHGDPDGMVLKTNTEGPENIVAACVAAGVRKLIHLSSVHAVMEVPLSEPFDEKRPYKEKGSFPYDYSKAAGEQVILKAIHDGVIKGFILRPSSVIGPFDYKPSEIGKALIDFYNQNIPVLPEGGYDFVDVRDVAETIINAIEKGKNGEIYLLSGKYYTLKEFAGIIRQVTKKKVPSIVLPFWFLKFLLPFVKFYGKIASASPVFTIDAITALKNGHPGMDNRKAAMNLGHKCRPLVETIDDFYKWNRDRGVLNE